MWVKIRGKSEEAVPYNQLPSVNIEPGDKLLLHYEAGTVAGQRRYVPKKLHYTTATFIELTSHGGIVVRSNLETRTRILRPEFHIADARKKEEFVGW